MPAPDRASIFPRLLLGFAQPGPRLGIGGVCIDGKLKRIVCQRPLPDESQPAAHGHQFFGFIALRIRDVQCGAHGLDHIVEGRR
jgi:hypothetical protein